jgi:hypothetical protein
MKLHGLLGVLLTASIATVANARPASAPVGVMVPNPALAPSGQLTRGFIPVPDSAFQPVDLTAGPPSRIIYLNNCKKTNGCTVYSGQENSLTQHSSIINGTIHLSAFGSSDAVWQQVMTCVKQTYAPFAITVTDVDPGNVPHWETMVAGLPTEAGQPNGVAGVSPFSCGVISNSITYAFANVLQGDVNQICWTVAQETAHSFGLDHEYLAPDPMTYLDGSYPKRFQNTNAQCGRNQVEACMCGGATQNSYKLINQLFGSPTPSPPKVTILDPANGAQVQAGFPVHGSFMDDQGVDKTELYVDGKLAQTLAFPPYAYNAPADLASGTHHVELRAYDLQGTPGSAFIDVVIGAPCTTDASCGSGKACIDGRCVVGPGQPGGLGEVCTGPGDCASGVCGNDGAGTLYCVEQCNPAANGCPSNFDCLATDATGTAGVCWPGAGDGGGGTSAGCAAGSSGTSALPIGLGLGFLLIGLRRRKR